MAALAVSLGAAAEGPFVHVSLVDLSHLFDMLLATLVGDFVTVPHVLVAHIAVVYL